MLQLSCKYKVFSDIFSRNELFRLQVRRPKKWCWIHEYKVLSVETKRRPAIEAISEIVKQIYEVKEQEFRKKNYCNSCARMSDFEMCAAPPVYSHNPRTGVGRLRNFSKWWVSRFCFNLHFSDFRRTTQAKFNSFSVQLSKIYHTACSMVASKCVRQQNRRKWNARSGKRSWKFIGM